MLHSYLPLYVQCYIVTSPCMYSVTQLPLLVFTVLHNYLPMLYVQCCIVTSPCCIYSPWAAVEWGIYQTHPLSLSQYTTRQPLVHRSVSNNLTSLSGILLPEHSILQELSYRYPATDCTSTVYLMPASDAMCMHTFCIMHNCLLASLRSFIPENFTHPFSSF